MMRKRIFLGFSTLLVGMALSAPAMVSAWNPFGDVCASKDSAAASSPICAEQVKSNPISGKNGILIKITRFLLVIIGVVAVIIIIIAGIQMILSTGDPSKIAGARNTIIYAAVGLVVAISASAIIQLIIGRL